MCAIEDYMVNSPSCENWEFVSYYLYITKHHDTGITHMLNLQEAISWRWVAN
jgi:hypothetical protein